MEAPPTTSSATHFAETTTVGVRPAAWEGNEPPPCAAALAGGRRDRWRHLTLHTSAPDSALGEVPRVLVERLTATRAYVA